MGDPVRDSHARRVVRIERGDVDNASQLERILQRLYMIVEPVVDLGVDDLDSAFAVQLRKLNRYHTSKGSERLRIVTTSPDVRRALGGSTGVFRFYESVEEALTAAV